MKPIEIGEIYNNNNSFVRSVRYFGNNVLKQEPHYVFSFLSFTIMSTIIDQTSTWNLLASYIVPTK